MIISRTFLYRLPIAFVMLLLATAILVRATAPIDNEPISIASLRASDSMTELASE